MIRFIGDIHGKWLRYADLIYPGTESVQVGDFGWGFTDHNTYVIEDAEARRAMHPLDRRTPPEMAVEFAMSLGKHRYIRGNHDNPAACLRSKYWIPDGLVENNTMYVGGAYSIDRDWRIEGYDWWCDEELSMTQLEQIINLYEIAQPEIMVTHDCPDGVAHALFDFYAKFEAGSRTRQAFDTMFEIHQPKLWLFGHWHEPRDEVINGTRFVCIPELCYIDIDPEQPLAGQLKLIPGKLYR